MIAAPNHTAECKHCEEKKSSDNFYVKYILDVITTDTGGQLLNKVQITSRANYTYFTQCSFMAIVSPMDLLLIMQPRCSPTTREKRQNKFDAQCLNFLVICSNANIVFIEPVILLLYWCLMQLWHKGKQCWVGTRAEFGTNCGLLNAFTVQYRRLYVETQACVRPQLQYMHANIQPSKHSAQRDIQRNTEYVYTENKD